CILCSITLLLTISEKMITRGKRPPCPTLCCFHASYYISSRDLGVSMLSFRCPPVAEGRAILLYNVVPMRHEVNRREVVEVQNSPSLVQVRRSILPLQSVDICAGTRSHPSSKQSTPLHHQRKLWPSSAACGLPLERNIGSIRREDA